MSNIHITFRDIPHSEAVETAIRSKIAKLQRFSDCITACRVVVHEPNRRHQHGNRFAVTIDITVPGAELVVGPSDHHSAPEGVNKDLHVSENMYIALRDSFQAMERQLKTYMQQRRRDGRQKQKFLQVAVAS